MGIFYVNHALGKNGKPINTYKIRTMIPNAIDLYDDSIEAGGLDAHGKVRGDERITRFGRILRRYWVDELPQIFTNLLRGNMRLVGIRPAPEELWAHFPEELKERALQHKPGFFGVNYLFDGDTVDDLITFENRYLDEKEEHPFLTDARYFFRLLHRIVFKGMRGY